MLAVEGCMSRAHFMLQAPPELLGYECSVSLAWCISVVCERAEGMTDVFAAR
jgi:hypothetical protein